MLIADLHIHSRYSHACSRDLSPENLWRWSQLKGITVVGSGDFTHPFGDANVVFLQDPQTLTIYAAASSR